jgi:di/tricarboxylate transporter
MEKTGIDKLIASALSTYIGGLEPFYILLIFFWVAALLTQVLSDAATTVLLAPIGLAFAKATSMSPVAAVIVITVGAVASFLTPIGHHGNLLILSPGGYKFTDFLRIGLPLTVLISLITCGLALRIWV